MKKEIIFSLLIIFLVSVFVYFRFFKKPDIDSYPTKVNSLQTQSKKSNFTDKISFEEVKKHNNEKDCWIIIEEKVYDVTDYIKMHPGGRVIVNFCGRDATYAFNARGFQKEPHSPKAREILKNYYLSDLIKQK